MTREQAQQRLEAWMNGDLHPDAAVPLQQDLAPFPDLLEEFHFWQQMGEIPADQPGPLLSQRLDDMLEAFRAEAGKAKRPENSWDLWLHRFWPRQPAYGLAAAMLCLALGLAGGWIAASSRALTSEDTLLLVQKELRDTRELAVLALLQQPMAGDRLRGVRYVAGMEKMHPTLQQALIRTLQMDSSVNVRLAALDALSSSADTLAVRVAIQSAFETESSPLVQVELLRVLADLDHPQARQILEQATLDSRLDETVRTSAGLFLQTDW